MPAADSNLVADTMNSNRPAGILAGQRLDPVTCTRAAIGAINRRDHAEAIFRVRQLLEDEASRLAALEVLTGILLCGVPTGALQPTARISIGITVLRDENHCAKAVELAATLVTAVANADTSLAAPALAALAGEHGLDILIVLVREAAARVEFFVGVDGDTVDAYYLASARKSSQ